MKTISARWGHSAIAITMDRYAHLMAGIDQRVAEAADQAMRPAMGEG